MAASSALAANIVDLTGDGWTLQSLARNISVPGHLPSVAHLDLHAAGMIGDPYYGANQQDLLWVAYENWTYVSDPIAGLLDASHNATTYLLFEGLDTYTSISLCGQPVGNTDNQFRQYAFDVSHLLQQQKDENNGSCARQPVLTLNFGSAPAIAERIANEPGQETWPPDVVINHELKYRNFVRKSQSDFGWDFVPAFSPAGPWKPASVVQLVADNEVYPRNAAFDLYRKGQMSNLPPDQSQPWVLSASIDVLGAIAPGSKMTYSVLDVDNNVAVSTGTLEDVDVTDQGHTVTGVVTLDDGDFELWWPAGMGSQKLYNVSVDITSPSGKQMASVTRRMGFRTIVLNQTPNTQEQIDQGIGNGSNWHFEINGHEFFAKGSNLVPFDAFLPRVGDDRMRSIFQMAVDSNMNMLRVWASGTYGPDAMYDVADELGLLLWSEFEFSDALYPNNPEFLDNVVREVTFQTRRLNHHASLAVWAGGNELETVTLPLALSDFFDELQTSGLEGPLDELLSLKASYETLFLKTLAPIVFGNTRSVSYMPSSTNSGYKELNFSASPPLVERYEASAAAVAAAPLLLAEGIPENVVQLVTTFPADSNQTTEYFRDTDYYNYTYFDLYDTTAIPRGRFAAEFGFYSYPSIHSWQQVLPDEKLRFNNTELVSRNRQVRTPAQTDDFDPHNLTEALYHGGLLTMAVEANYPIPKFSDPLKNFSAWCDTTQIFQADFTKTQIQFYRWGASQPWRNLGSLYWQLNDVWPGASTWSSIEYDGRWKYLQYAVRDLYKPVIVTPLYDSVMRQLNVSVNSDLWSDASGHAELTWYTWDGEQIGDSEVVPFTVGPLNSTLVHSSILDTDTLDYTNAILRMNITATGRAPNSNETQTYTHENTFHPVPLSEAKLVDPGIELTYDESSQTFTVAATTGVAPWTWLDYPDGPVVTFDENAFTLFPGQPRKIGYTVRKDDGSEWVDHVSVRSIWNNTLTE